MNKLNDTIKIVNNLEPKDVSFDELFHGDVFLAYGASVKTAGVSDVPMMKFNDSLDGNPIAICLDDGDWFYYNEAKRWQCRRVKVTLTLDSFL